ncbi:hypothetical protein, partial [Marinobacter sp. DUT-1]|uniref:hypothetical protein n=1 Tax=Marinobacter sp. DUT-1 TaxID=3412037 RepID=UPI003D176055
LFIAFLPERLWVCNIKEKVSDDRFVSLCAFGVVFVCYLFWLGTSIWLVARLAFYFLPLAGVFLVMVVGNVKNVMWIFMAKIVLLFGLIFLSSYISGPQISVIFNSLI